MAKVKLNDYHKLRFVYEMLAGEVEDIDGNELVISCMPDDSGCDCDNGDKDVFMPIGTLYIDEEKLKGYE